MRKTTRTSMPARSGARLDLQSRCAATALAGRAVVAVGACLLACLLLCVDISPLASDAYASTWPAGASQERVCLAFGEAYTFDKATYTHRGVDISADANEKVRAPLDGMVSFVGRVPAGDSAKAEDASGETMTAVSIDLEDGRTVTLMPFRDVSVKEGQAVKEGDSIGRLAAHGDRSSGSPHLHMGLKEGKSYRDPMSLFGGAVKQSARSKASLPLALSKEASGPETKQGLVLEPAVDTQEALASDGAVPVQESDPSFGTISSGAVSQIAFESSEALASERTPLFSVISAACAAQLNSMLEAYKGLGERLCLPVQLLLLASVLLIVFVAAAAVACVIARIRRTAALGKTCEKSSLYKGRGGASIYGLFPAPGTSFITRGRLAQRR